MTKHPIPKLIAASVIALGGFLSVRDASLASAETVSATLTATDYYVSLTGNSSAITLNPTANGAATTSSDTLSVTTNSRGGYQVFLSMDTSTANSNRLYLDGDDTSEFYIAPASGTFSLNDPSTLSTIGDNTWGFSMTGNASEWAGVPVAGNDALIASGAASTSSPTTSASFGVHYGTKVTNAVANGTYTGTVTYTAIIDAANIPGGRASASPSSVAAGAELTITTSLYTNMTIDPSEVTATIDGTSCPVTSVETVNNVVVIKCTAPALSVGTSAPVVVNISRFGKTYTTTNNVSPAQTIQASLAAWCSAQTTPDASVVNVPEVTLVDARDGEAYTIRKLADGNCWMTQNLRLGKAGTTYAINSTNSDTTTSFNLPAATTSGNSNYDILQVFYQNDTNRQAYGNYYNWYTATAQTGTQSITSGDATGSICPKGMKLPPNAGNGSFQNLTTAYSIANNAAGATKLQGAPLSFPLAGGYNSGFYDQGSYGYYWSRTASNGTLAYILAFLASYVGPQSTDSKSLGFSVRCVLVP